MTTEARTMQDQMMDELQRLSGPLKLGTPEPGEQNSALARLPELEGGLRSPVLLVREERSGELSVRVRGAAQAGTSASDPHRAAVFFLAHLAQSDDQQQGAGAAEYLFELLAKTALGESRNPEDLIGLFAAASNDCFRRSRAALDARDGEVWVEQRLTGGPDDRDTLPEGFEDAVRGVVAHAEVIGRFEQHLRRRVGSESPPSDWMLERMVERIRQGLVRGTEDSNPESTETI